MTRLIAALALGLALLAPAAAMAAEKNGSYSNFLQRLSQANRMQPLQNPEYTRGTQVLGWRILDRTNKVIGEVDDVILSDRGALTSVAVDFNRLRLGAPVYLNASEVPLRPSGNGYVMGMNYSQVENLYPSLLADIETASGIDDENFSAKKLIGAQVISDDGRSLGRVEDVLFTGRGTRAAALYVGMGYGNARGKALAVPFDLVRYSARGGALKVSLGDDQADALVDFFSRKD